VGKRFRNSCVSREAEQVRYVASSRAETLSGLISKSRIFIDAKLQNNFDNGSQAKNF
jgi:hypothetical protein